MKSTIIRVAASSRDNKTTRPLTSDWKTIFQSRLGNAAAIFAAAFLLSGASAQAAPKNVQAQMATRIGKMSLAPQEPKEVQEKQASIGAPHVITDTGNYAFSTATNASLTDMSSGTTQLVAANQDDTASAVTNIGFDFFFQGVRFSQFSANSNGLMRLGGTVVQGASPYKPLAQAGLSLITPYGADQRTHTAGKVHFKVTGSTPNRVLIVEWLNMQANFNSGGTADLTYQARLYEATGVIEFVYGSMTMSTAGAADANSRDPNIGFSSSNTAGTVGSVTAPQSGTPDPTYDGASATPVANLYTAGAITTLTSATDGSRRIFTFTPPTPTAPTALNFTAVTAASMTLNWTDSPDELAYAVYRSTDGINYTLRWLGSTECNQLHRQRVGFQHDLFLAGICSFRRRTQHYRPLRHSSHHSSRKYHVEWNRGRSLGRHVNLVGRRSSYVGRQCHNRCGGHGNN